VQQIRANRTIVQSPAGGVWNNATRHVKHDQKMTGSGCKYGAIVKFADLWRCLNAVPVAQVFQGKGKQNR
tara:strand:+ start:229857 stop:230066 length:210 start_codon:yes stop_codon:yes gene_type:complete